VPTVLIIFLSHHLSKQNPQTIIDQCLAQIAQHLPGFKHRAQQMQMIAAVQETLTRASQQETQQGQSILVVEGPTGTGKSLGYLLPAMVMAKALNKKLVVSSATVMLQEQLANKDIPFVVKHADLNISYAIAKGRGRYICTAKLKQRINVGDPAQLEMLSSESIAEDKNNLLIKLAASLDNGKWSGDRDSLTKNIPDTLWSQFTNDRHGCVKKLCAHFANCPFYKARHTLETVDVIIVNHDLLLADVAMGGGVILPDPAETFYCLDEAHHFASKAVKQFAAAHTINGALAWLEKIEVTVNKAVALLKQHSVTTNVKNLAEAVAEYLQDFGGALTGFAELQSGSDSAMLRFKHGIVPAPLLSLSENLAKASKSLHGILYAIQENLKKAKVEVEGQGIADLYNRALIDIGFFIGRVENLMAVWTLFSQETPVDSPPIAKWITAAWSANKNQQEQLDYNISASPVSAGKLLAEKFWNRVAGAVLASATLRSLGTFDLLLRETGLNSYPQTTCLPLDSPFDFQQQGKLIIPNMRSDPRDPIAHTQEIIALLPKLLPSSGNNGALVLFASQKQMHEVARKLPNNFKKLLLIQGKQAKEKLLEEHFARIKNGFPSILFGLASFAEGLDLPGNACNYLIIAKLPFAVPDEPVAQTLADWITQQGGDPFMEMTLPATSIKLIQAVGRLIRAETDMGTVAILDTRLKTKQYGRLLCKSLPPFKQVAML
jgi:ATP-dependent DNA helicase DinG